MDKTEPIVDKFYGVDFIREKVRKRDNYKCLLCGKQQKVGERRLDVHHMDNEFDGDNGKKYQNNPICRMITLCHKCHMTKVSHRPYYPHLKETYAS